MRTKSAGTPVIVEGHLWGLIAAGSTLERGISRILGRTPRKGGATGRRPPCGRSRWTDRRRTWREKGTASTVRVPRAVLAFDRDLDEQ